MSWRLLNTGGNGILDVHRIVGVGVRLTNQTETGSQPTAELDVDVDNIRVLTEQAPQETVVLVHEGFEAGAPDGYAATDAAPTLLRDTESRQDVWVYGSPDEASSEIGTAGQYLSVRKQAAELANEQDGGEYEGIFVDLMLRGPGEVMGVAGLLDLTKFEVIRVDARGPVTALLLQDADGDLFGHEAWRISGEVIPGSFEVYEAWAHPMSWRLLNAGGDGKLDVHRIVGLGVRLTNEGGEPGTQPRAALDVDVDNIRVLP